MQEKACDIVRKDGFLFTNNTFPPYFLNLSHKEYKFNILRK